jgi:NTE family protein
MTESRTALILTGGGARAGYQIGVLKAIRELLPSRGAIRFRFSAAPRPAHQRRLAGGFAEDFGAGVVASCGLGELQRPSGISRRPAGIGLAGARWLSTLALGWLTRRAPRSLLDNAPLRPAGEQASTSVASDARSKAAPSIRSALPAPAIRPARA